MHNSRETGANYEAKAAEYLKQKGYQILDRNYRTRQGEIDIVARNEKYLVFIEVKYRTRHAQGTPEEAVDSRKQKRISGAALYYMYQQHYPLETPVRFDVISITGQTIKHIENAFLFAR